MSIERLRMALAVSVSMLGGSVPSGLSIYPGSFRKGFYGDEFLEV
jgi:hypothetical protein